MPVRAVLLGSMIEASPSLKPPRRQRHSYHDGGERRGSQQLSQNAPFQIPHVVRALIRALGAMSALGQKRTCERQFAEVRFWSVSGRSHTSL